jgi:hypothetical protein
MPTCFLTLGTPRSGTSLVAGLQHHCGLFMGERFWQGLGIEEWNPKGFFADLEFEHLLTRQFLDQWPVLPATELQDDVAADLKALMDRRCLTGSDWGFKASRTAAILQHFVSICPFHIKIILTEREPERSVASWLARSGPGVAREVISNSAACIEAALNSVNVVAIHRVSYDAIFDDRDSTVAALASFIGQSVTRQAIELIDPSLRRH